MKTVEILVFEGVDKSGKDTLINEVHKITKYKYLTINRFSASNYVYGMLRKRKVNACTLRRKEFILKNSMNAIMIYVTANKKTIAKRIVDTKEKDIAILEIEKIKKLYRQYLKLTALPYIIVDTTGKTKRQSAWDVVKGIQEYESL